MAAGLPFSIEPGDVLEPEPQRPTPETAIYAGRWPAIMLPVLTVAWLAEPEGATLAEVVTEELARLDAETTLVDYEQQALGGLEAVRTLTVHREDAGLLTATEQWRLLAGGRRWVLSALTALGDQPALGPPLAAAAATFRAS